MHVIIARSRSSPSPCRQRQLAPVSEVGGLAPNEEDLLLIDGGLAGRQFLAAINGHELPITGPDCPLMAIFPAI